MGKIKLGCILLAAGQSKRFGDEDKLLFELCGKPLVRHAIEPIPLDLIDKTVIVGSNDEVLNHAKSCGIETVFNKHSENGISASIKSGINAVGDADGYMFVTCDQPFRKESSLRRLIALFNENPDKIIAMSYKGVRGNPVIFPKDLKDELISLEGDNGGGTIISKRPDRLLLCEAEDGAEMVDVDSKEDLVKLSKKL